MSQAKMNLDEDLVKIMTGSGFNNFTVLELRSAYMALSRNKELDQTEARRFVYRHILRLEKKGFLKRMYSKKRKRTYYSKTESFTEDQFSIIKDSLDEPSNPDTTEMASDSKLLQGLTEKLQHYKVELLTCIGETDEYKALCSEFPELKAQLQDRYNRARDNSSKVLGRIKALESLIDQQKRVKAKNETS